VFVTFYETEISSTFDPLIQLVPLSVKRLAALCEFLSKCEITHVVAARIIASIVNKLRVQGLGKMWVFFFFFVMYCRKEEKEVGKSGAKISIIDAYAPYHVFCQKGKHHPMLYVVCAIFFILFI
jgi:hypothetical protein